MYLYWWIVLIIVFVFIYLVTKVDRLSHQVKDLKEEINKLEGIENDSSDNAHFERTGDCEGRS